MKANVFKKVALLISVVLINGCTSKPYASDNMLRAPSSAATLSCDKGITYADPWYKDQNGSNLISYTGKGYEGILTIGEVTKKYACQRYKGTWSRPLYVTKCYENETLVFTVNWNTIGKTNDDEVDTIGFTKGDRINCKNLDPWRRGPAEPY